MWEDEEETGVVQNEEVDVLYALVQVVFLF